MAGISHFGIFDYILVGGCLLFPIVLGFLHVVLGKSGKGPSHLLVGDRIDNLFNVIPVAISIMMALMYFSGTTAIDYPSKTYEFGIEIFTMNAVGAIFMPLGAFTFIPMFYGMKLTTIFEYLEKRFDSRAVRQLAAVTFIVQQLVLTTIVMYATAIVLKSFLGLPIWVSVSTIGITGTLYTCLGGLKTLVWAQTFQLTATVCGLVAVVTKATLDAGGFSEAFKIASEYERSRLFNFRFDPFVKHNFYNFLLGYGFYTFMLPACDQLQVQRYSSLRSRSAALKAVILSVPLKLILMALCLMTGIAILAAHTKKFPVGLGKNDDIVSAYVTDQLRHIPGMMGLFASTIVCFSLSLYSSPINSLSAVTWQDFIENSNCSTRLSDSAATTVVRCIGIFYGVLTMVLAIGADHLYSIFDVRHLTHSTIGVTHSVLSGLFIMGLFFPCSNKYGAIVGFLSGLTVMVFISFNDISQLDSTTITTTVDNNTVLSAEADAHRPLVDHPDPVINNENQVWLDIVGYCQFSHLLYPIVGAVITVTIGLVFSIITGGVCQCYKKKLAPQHLVPLARLLCYCSKYRDDEIKPLEISGRYADRIASVNNIYSDSTRILDPSRPPSYTYYQYSIVPTIERQSMTNSDEVYTELTPDIIPNSREYENI